MLETIDQLERRGERLIEAKVAADLIGFDVDQIRSSARPTTRIQVWLDRIMAHVERIRRI